MGEGLGVRATGVRADKQLETQNSKPETFLTPRERRWFLQPLWRQALSVLLIVALMLATTNTNVHAAIPNPIFYYHVGDHLGSSNLVTDRNGALVQHREYWAFGQQRVRSESAQDYVFNRYTGQVFDDETGLYYYGARYYDPELGRFIQPDTIVPYPDDPQTLNRYSYVNNNPLKYTDPMYWFSVNVSFGVEA
jgi:RHS repeat-associated protein